MEHVDFGYVGEDNITIYRSCFAKYTTSRFLLTRPKAEWLKLVKETETVFEFLVEQGLKNGYNVNLILEIPDLCGATCFHIATQCSEKISRYCIDNVMKLNCINIDMMVPDFIYPEISIKMMQKGINPFVINYEGDSQSTIYPSRFKTEEAKRLLATFPRSVHFSLEDIKCTATCGADCSSNFRKFFLKNGPLVEMTEKNRIGTGGFGKIYKELFHGIPMAMKCLLMGKIENRDYGHEAVSDLEKLISELRIQIATVGSGIIVPSAFIRQQNQEQDANGKWVAKNYHIYIYPLYDCDLYKLHENNGGQFTEGIIADIIHQCFIRIGFNKKVTSCSMSHATCDLHEIAIK